MRWELLEIAQIGRNRVPETVPHVIPDYTPSALRILPPGNYKLDNHLGSPPGIHLSLFVGIEIVFRDSRGRRWTRRASGKLKRSRISPHWFRNNREYAFQRTVALGGTPFARISRVKDD